MSESEGAIEVPDAPVTLSFRVGPGGLAPDPDPDIDDDELSGPPVPADAFVAGNGQQPEEEDHRLSLATGAPAEKAKVTLAEIEPPKLGEDVGWIGDGGAQRYPAKVARIKGPTLAQTAQGDDERARPILDLFVFGPDPHGGYRRNVHHVSRVIIQEEEHWCFLGRDYL